MDTATFTTSCPTCGDRFAQPMDPGRHRVYCTNACRQKAYRTRQRHQRARQEYQQYRRSAGAQRGNEKRYQGRYDPKREKARRQIERLLAKAASTTFEPEAEACRMKAQQLRDKYGL